MANIAMRDQEERRVEVNRNRLLEKLKENRKQHIAEYLEAVNGYKELATQQLADAYAKANVQLEKNRVDAAKRIDEFDPANPRLFHDRMTLVQQITLDLKVPRSSEDAYDLAIDTFEWDTREVIELTTAEFQCFVRDKWDWSDEFSVTNALYSNKR